jgi:hypothetical protein
MPTLQRNTHSKVQSPKGDDCRPRRRSRPRSPLDRSYLELFLVTTHGACRSCFGPRTCGVRLHRMRVAGNTLYASCCRTCRCHDAVRRPAPPRRTSSRIASSPKIDVRESARALNRDISVSRTSWHKGVILGRNGVFGVFRL